MKKLFVFGTISLMLLAVLLSGCETTGQAYVRSLEPQCPRWEQKCEAGNQRACKYLKRCVDVPTSEDFQHEITNLNEQKATKEEILEMLGQCKLVNTFERRGSAVGDFLADGMTGNEFCQDQGYYGCLFIQESHHYQLYESDDNSCTNMFDNDVFMKITDCTTTLNEEDFTVDGCSNGDIRDTDFYHHITPSVYCCQS
jgi:hypothetical protein